MINGKNNGITTEVKKSVNNYIGLKFKFPFDINVGDQFEITAGCNKEFSTCCSKFNNAINFRGEPNLPRNEKVFKTFFHLFGGNTRSCNDACLCRFRRRNYRIIYR